MPDSTATMLSNPDPSVLTTAMTRHEITALRDLLFTRIEAVEKANQVFADGIQRVPTILDREIAKITLLFQEKFSGIATQFAERDVRTTSDKQAASVGVAAALQAQKEMAASQNESNSIAVKKSDDATTKLIDSILLSIGANAKAIDDKIGAINSRLDRAEAATTSAHQSQADTRLGMGSVVGLIGGIVGVLGLLISLAVAASRLGNSQPLTVNQPAAQGLIAK